MAKTAKPKPGKSTNELQQVIQKKKEADAESTARTSLDPIALASVTSRHFTKLGNDSVSINAVSNEMQRQIEQLKHGDLSHAESMLMAQAHTLDAIFNKLASTATNQTLLTHYEAFLRLALKAQGQCRATLETLAGIKHPTVPTFVKQANIVHGPQQINNAIASPDPQAIAHEKNSTQPNELLGVAHEQRQRLDASTA